MTLNRREAEDQTAVLLEELERELAGTVSRRDIEVVGRDHFESLWQRATVTGFVPLIVYRQTKEDLLHRSA